MFGLLGGRSWVAHTVTHCEMTRLKSTIILVKAEQPQTRIQPMRRRSSALDYQSSSVCFPAKPSLSPGVEHAGSILRQADIDCKDRGPSSASNAK